MPHSRRTTLFAVMVIALTVIGGAVVGAAVTGSTPHSGWARPVVRAMAEFSATAATGSCCVPLLRAPLAVVERVTRPAIALFGISAAATLVWLWVDGAERVGVSVSEVTMGQVFSGSSGDPGMKLRLLLALGCALAVSGLAWVYRGGAELPFPGLAAVGAIGVVAPSLTGHLSQDSLGTIMIAAHVVAATVWLGGLIGMAILFRSRADWSWGLPQFSRIALPAVATLALTGIVAALVRLRLDDDLALSSVLDTGAGRLLLIKLLGLVAITFLAWWQRRNLLSHTGSVTPSARGLGAELLLAAAIIGVAATLAGTA